MCTSSQNVNHPFVVWGVCYLWLASIFSILWSLALFMYVGDMLILTGTDNINGILLLSGIMLLPTNITIMCSIAEGKKIDQKNEVICCPLYLCILSIIAINAVGVVLCIIKLSTFKPATAARLRTCMSHYRTVPNYKHFVDNLQWSLRCCGRDSFRDWFDYEWYDKIQDFEWDPSQNSRSNRDASSGMNMVTDSVPLSCCKSGSCVSNYLLELGTRSIHTEGCIKMLNTIIMTSMIIHIIVFFSVCVVEAVILTHIRRNSTGGSCHRSCANMFNVRHIMSAKDNFSASSSLQLNPDDSDEFERIEQRLLTPQHNKRVDTYRSFPKVYNDDPESHQDVEKTDDD